MLAHPTPIKTILVTKLDGRKEPFVEDKLRASLKRAGARPDLIEEIVERIVSDLESGMTTSEIYRKAFLLLNKKDHKPTAARYSLRRAVMALGPSGFPFEKYIAELFRTQGYKAETGLIIKGSCAEHEIDVLAQNDERFIVVEAKFHNDLMVKSDLKVVLYVKARLDDLRKTSFAGRKLPNLTDEGWLITNTKFTHHATSYARCAGLTVIGWNYPGKGNLQDMIEEANLHPLTCLTTLSLREKQELLGQGVVLCRSVGKDEQILRTMGFKENKIRQILNEVELLCPITN